MRHWPGSLNLLLVRVMHFTDTYLPRRDGVITSLRTLRLGLAEAGHHSTTVVPFHPGQNQSFHGSDRPWRAGRSGGPEPAGLAGGPELADWSGGPELACGLEPDLVRLAALPCGVADLRLARWPLRPLSADALKLLAAHRPDLIHVHTPGPIGLLGVLAAQRLGLPLVQTYHTDLHAYADAYRVPAFALRCLARLYARRLGTTLPRPLLCTDRSNLIGATNRVDRGEQDSRLLCTRSRNHLDQQRCVDGCRAKAARSCQCRGPVSGGDCVDECSADDGCGAQRRRTRMLDLGIELLFGSADAVIVPTPAVLERVNLPVDPARIYLVPTGVAAPGAAADISHWGIAPDDRVVLFVGRVNREKGIDVLLPAFERVLLAEPRARLVLVGAVYEPRWLRRMIRHDRVIITGQQSPEAVAAAYQRAEIFAFPSGTDTQALVLQEAALAGVPSVLVDPVLHQWGALAGAAVLATSEGFADGMRSLLRDPGFATELGARARANAARHTPEAFTAAILDIYGKFVPQSTPLGFAQLEGVRSDWVA